MTFPVPRSECRECANPHARLDDQGLCAPCERKQAEEPALCQGCGWPEAQCQCIDLSLPHLQWAQLYMLESQLGVRLFASFAGSMIDRDLAIFARIAHQHFSMSEGNAS